MNENYMTEEIDQDEHDKCVECNKEGKLTPQGYCIECDELYFRNSDS